LSCLLDLTYTSDSTSLMWQYINGFNF